MGIKALVPEARRIRHGDWMVIKRAEPVAYHIKVISFEFQRIGKNTPTKDLKKSVHDLSFATGQDWRNVERYPQKVFEEFQRVKKAVSPGVFWNERYPVGTVGDKIMAELFRGYIRCEHSNHTTT
jgi:hypothetical protein